MIKQYDKEKQTEERKAYQENTECFIEGLVKIEDRDSEELAVVFLKRYLDGQSSS